MEVDTLRKQMGWQVFFQDKGSPPYLMSSYLMFFIFSYIILVLLYYIYSYIFSVSNARKREKKALLL